MTDYDGRMIGKWKGRAPLTITYSISPDFPDEEKALIRQAADRWSSDCPEVDYKEVPDNGQVRVSLGQASMGTSMTGLGIDRNGIDSALVTMDPDAFGNVGVYAHELGHGWGLGEGYGGSNPDPSDVMAGTSPYPGQTSLDLLAGAYGRRSKN